MIQLTNENFKTEVNVHDGLVLVDFYSVTCGPCRALEPALRSAEAKFPKMRFCRAEVTDCRHYFEEFGVNYVPALILFRSGKMVDRRGFMSERDLINWLTEKGK